MGIRTSFAVLAFILTIVSAAFSSAEIKEDDLNKQVTLTEKAALLSQVDAVSLYLTSDKVAYAPRLTNGNVIEVETTVLDKVLLSSRSKLEGFVTRQTKTFISVLKERLPVYAPSIAKTFDAGKDIKFTVNATAKRTPVAKCEGGTWIWDENFSLVPELSPVSVSQTPQLEKKGKLSCNCPAKKK